MPDQYTFPSPDIHRKHAEAMVAKLEAETAALQWDSKTSRVMSESADLAHTRDVERRNWEEASDLENRVFHFADDVNPNSVGAAIDVLSHWRRLDRNNLRSYEIVLTSPGGAVVSGYKLFAYLRQIAKERPVVTVASGLCASMATIIHQAGTERLIEEGCSYLVHDPSGVAVGSIGNLNDTTDWINALKTKGHQILAERSTLSVEEIAEKSSRKDWWCLPEEVITIGFADSIR